MASGLGLVGVVGVGFVALGPDAGFDVVGLVAGLCGPVAMALGVTLTKRWGRPVGVGPLAFAGWQLTAGGLVLVPPVAFVEGVPEHIDLAAVGGYLWLGVLGGLLAYTLWFNGLWTLPVTATALLALLSPLVAAALGALILDETFAVVQLVGFALALAALVAGQLTPSVQERNHS